MFVIAYFGIAIMLLKCTVRIIYANYQRLENAGKQNIRKISKILFTRKKKIIIKISGQCFPDTFLFLSFPLFFLYFLAGFGWVHEYVSVFGCMPVSLYM